MTKRLSVILGVKSDNVREVQLWTNSFPPIAHYQALRRADVPGPDCALHASEVTIVQGLTKVRPSINTPILDQVQVRNKLLECR